jgi:hypothetical protein
VTETNCRTLPPQAGAYCGAGATGCPLQLLEEARRSLDQQKSVLEGLRSRSGSTVGFGTVVATLLAGYSLKDGADPSAWTWGGLAALLVATVLSVFILWSHTLSLTSNIESIDMRIGDGDDIDTMLRDTAFGIHRDVSTNETVLLCLHRAYVLSLVAILVEGGLLLTGLARR